MTGSPALTFAQGMRRTVETATRPRDTGAWPGTPQPQLRIPPGDLSVPIADGGRRHRLLRRIEGYERIVAAGQPLPDTAAMASWRDERSRKPLLVIATLDHSEGHLQIGGPYYLLHVSMSYPHKLPEWWEVAAVKDVLFGPDQDACMVLPRASDYVNIHPFCFQMWQLPWVWGIR